MKAEETHEKGTLEKEGPGSESCPEEQQLEVEV
jgi:hypothetical protein